MHVIAMEVDTNYGVVIILFFLRKKSLPIFCIMECWLSHTELAATALQEDKNCSHLHALACVQNVLRQCKQNKPVSMLLHSYVVSCTETWEVFPSNGSYVLAFHLARHTQELHRKQQKV